MAPTESKSTGSSKNDFKQSFEAKTKSWIKDLPTEVLENRLETVSALPEQNIHGFENEISLLKNFLLDQKVYNEFKSLVVVGEYGVGKTALCQMMFNDEDVKSVYAPMIWVCMHNKKIEDKRIYVLKRILEGIGVEDDILKSIETEIVEDAAANQEAGGIDGGMVQEKELSILLYAVNLNLKWKKYLIVFDDVRETDNWNENLGVDEKELKGKQWGTHLSDGFPKESGGRVIYTTRDETLAKKLVGEEHEIHRLWPLSDTEIVQKIYEEAPKESKEMYDEAAKENKSEPWVNRATEKEHPGNKKKFKEELMNKSRGLPLAARMMAMSNPVFETPKEQTDSVNSSISEKDSSTQPLKACED